MLKIDRTNTDTIIKIAIICIIIGLFFSNALKSIGIISLAASILIHPDTLKNYRILFKNKLFLSSLIIATIFIISIVYGNNYYTYLMYSKNKFLYFFVPVAILNTSFKKNELFTLKFLFVLCTVIQSLFAVQFILFNQETEKMYSTGNVLPTISNISHVYISWLISISILLLVNELKKQIHPLLKTVMLITTIWLVVYIHLFAVRTGIIILYMFILFYIIYLLTEHKKTYAVLLLLLLSLGIIVSYQFSKNLKNKVDYIYYDFNKFKSNTTDFQEYSDSRRLQSIKVGLEIIKENPWLGCGIGNIKEKTDAVYLKKYPFIKKENQYGPHSFYIYIFCCFGILLGTLVVLCLLYPLYYFVNRKQYLLFSIYSSVILISFWDTVLLTIFGECMYLLIIAFGIKKTIHESITD